MGAMHFCMPCRQWEPRSSAALPLLSGGASRFALAKTSRLEELQPLEAYMAVLADDDVIMHGDAERRRGLHDGLGHLDIGA